MFVLLGGGGVGGCLEGGGGRVCVCWGDRRVVWGGEGLLYVL